MALTEQSRRQKLPHISIIERYPKPVWLKQPRVLRVLVLQHTCHEVLLLLTLLRSLGMAPCPDAVSAEAAAFANTYRIDSPAHAVAIIEPPLPEPEPDADTDVGSEDIDLALYCMEITDDQADPVPAAEPPEEPMPWTESAVYCRHCQMWLRGQQQWDDHVPGKKTSEEPAARATECRRWRGAAPRILPILPGLAQRLGPME